MTTIKIPRALSQEDQQASLDREVIDLVGPHYSVDEAFSVLVLWENLQKSVEYEARSQLDANKNGRRKGAHQADGAERAYNQAISILNEEVYRRLERPPHLYDRVIGRKSLSVVRDFVTARVSPDILERMFEEAGISPKEPRSES